MKNRIFDSLLALRGFTISMIVSMMMMATFSCSSSAQTAASAVPAQADLPAASTTHLRKTFDHLKTGFALRGFHLTVACEACHVGGTFKGTPKNCSGCHGVGRLIAATPKNQDHIPTTKECDACHNNAASFRTAIMDHTGLTIPCSVCHNGAYSFIKSVPSDAVHNNTNLPCDSCHKNTFVFTGSRYDHTNANSDCESCHNGFTAPGKSANHLPTAAGQVCSACHTAAVTPGWPFPVSFLGVTTYEHGATNAVGTATCTSCHGAINGVKAKSGSHIKTVLQCDMCHTSTLSFAAPNWVMDHAANNNLTSGCATCHTGNAFDSTIVKGKPVNPPHITTSAGCETCHNNVITFVSSWTMDHSVVSSARCDSCHGDNNNIFATGVTVANKSSYPPQVHVSTSADCGTCHKSTTSFIAATIFDHASVQNLGGSCTNCHGTSGQRTSGAPSALGQPAGHLVDARSCDVCHTTSSYIPGGFKITSYNHTGVIIGAGQCGASCHNGVLINGNSNGAAEPPSHINTNGSFACDACHKSTTSFLGAVMDHNTITPPLICATCHDGHIPGVVTKSLSHFPTTGNMWASGLGCEACHSSTVTPGGFTSWTMSHAGINPGSCGSCHGGTGGTSLASIGVKAQPSTATHIPTNTVAVPACDSCHNGTSTFTAWTMNHTGITAGAGGNCENCHNNQYAGVKSKSATHLSPVSTSCGSCHIDFTTFLGATFSHSGITTGCASCHDGRYAAVVTKPASTHIPTTATANKCETCHADTTTPGGFKNKLANSTFHTGLAAGSCLTCHNGQFADVVVKPAGHVGTSLSCDSCHKSINSYAVGGFLIPVGSSHVSITAGQCGTSCHNGSTVNGTTNGTPEPSTHIPTTGPACDACHTDTASNHYTSFLNATMVHSPTYLANCENCHASQYPGVVSKSGNHIPTTISTCVTCHNNTLAGTSTGGFSTQWKMDHTGITSGCASCHDGHFVVPIPVASQATNHIPLVADCGVCHSVAAGVANVTAAQASPTGAGFANAVMVHNGQGIAITSNCVSCHGGQTFQGTPPGSTPKSKSATPSLHITTTATCESCHLPANTSTNQFATSSAMIHTGISTSCSNCHLAAGDSKVGVAQIYNVVGKPVVGHIATTAACEACHSPAPTAAAGPTGGPSNGFKSPNWTMNHTVVSARCDSCHGGQTFLTVTPVNKSAYPNHVVTAIITGPDCSVCHAGTTTFKNGVFSHTGINFASNPCSSCHNNAIALGQPAGKHIAISNKTCDSCHPATSTNIGGFAAPNWKMDHTSLSMPPAPSIRCDSCHGLTQSTTYQGVTITSQNAFQTHPVAIGVQDCGACHGDVTSFLSNTTYTHVGVVTGSCTNCHGTAAQRVANAPTALGQPGGHLVDARSCDVCHTSGSYAPGGFKITNGPFNHSGAIAGQCTAGGCHSTSNNQLLQGATIPTTPAHIPTTLSCDACHSVASLSFLTAVMNHTGNTTSGCSNCHNGQVFGGVTVVNKPTGALHITSSVNCEMCHTSTTVPGGFQTWKMGAPEHISNNNTTGCAACHAAGKSFQNTTGQALVTLATPPHVPVGTIACETCHSKTAFNLGDFGNIAAWTMGTAGHAAVASTQPKCATCHVAGVATSSYTGVAAQNANSIHIPSAYYPVEDCGVCHTAATTSNYSVGGFLLLNGVGLPNHTGMTGNCANCHNHTIAKGVADFPAPGTHMTFTGDCVGCHTPTNTTNYTTFLGATAGHDTSAAGQAAALHNCAKSGCHVSGGSGKLFTTSHIPSSTPGATIALNGVGQCDYCHTTAYTTMLFTSYDSTKVHTAGTSIPTTAKCSTCHNGSYTGEGTIGAQAKTLVNHIPTALTDASGLDCNTCHYYTGSAPVISATGFAGKQSTGEYMNHNGIQGGAPYYCVSCHLKGLTYLSGAQLISHNGASTSKDCSSSSCHKPLGKTGSFGPYVR